ncbi:aromatic ring-hydroxylating oxygenase subunit alpha [Stenotrophobium rhamnosiphilum]|uniref:(2Fe-2S)-binding protein n=1 Tax=Stenotrophobium rhamnosiphilum TaxID=2029166 RepID=A0A2T5MDV8_9GAMM|nr:aromatic ring-hydroxylating dioxygenase subunit alpha [Stenotrophobium rhamnosiphilum]PTU30765.1 (2Fe-2S)-binding protein [Stenotrophobium rhamnosiphilum]
MNKPTNLGIEDLTEPLTYSAESFLSRDYAKEEGNKLWAKVWQHAGRVEEIPEVGNFITYNVGDDSILIVRTAADTIKAYHNVCSHRGRQLVDTPPEAHSACGKRTQFVCGFHAWRYDLDGNCTHKLDEGDWKGTLTDVRTHLGEVKVDTWGGWLFINMDANAAPLHEYLDPVTKTLGPFSMEKMRYKWRQWVIFDCNWKTAIEAFMEPYHVEGTHTQLLKYGQYYAYSKAHKLHGVSGFDERDPTMKMKQSSTITRAGKGADARVSTYELQNEIYTTVNNASTTETLVNAAKRLVDELPEGTPPGDVIKHWLASARADDAKRGIEWPTITPEQMGEAGLAWSVFPNMSILQGITFALCYRARPYGDDPNKCIFESYAIERFPEGQEPKTEWVYAEATAEKWGKVLSQDFSNMAAVQRGMKSRGFRGTLPNPHQERKVTNFHRVLADYMQADAPKLIK